MKIKSGNSNFQQEIEKKMLLLYAKKYRIVFDDSPPILDGCSVQIDGYSKKKEVVCEAFAHVGKLKSGQIRKVAQDALKLIYLDEKLRKVHKKVLIFADEGACKSFEIFKNIQSSEKVKWIADCLRIFKIDPWLAPLSKKDKTELLRWQKKQGKNFKNKE